MTICSGVKGEKAPEKTYDNNLSLSNSTSATLAFKVASIACCKYTLSVTSLIISPVSLICAATRSSKSLPRVNESRRSFDWWLDVLGVVETGLQIITSDPPSPTSAVLSFVTRELENFFLHSGHTLGLHTEIHLYIRWRG